MKFKRFLDIVDQVEVLLTTLYLPLLGLGIILVALFVRKALLPFESLDYILYLKPWYDFIQTHGGFAALRYDFSNYNPPYLYLLAIATIVPIKANLAIKGISIGFDFFLAFTVYLLVIEKYARKTVAFFAAALALYLPTVLINSAMWGQADAIYSSFCLLSLYFMMKKKGAYSSIAAGVAFAFKLQTIFFLPVLIIGVLKKEIRAVSLVFIPAVYLVSLLPAKLAGRSLGSMLHVYVGQSQGNLLTANAPNIYQWLPNSYFSVFNSVGIYFTLGLVLLILFLIHQFTGELTPEMTVKSALLLTLVIPFFLPQMHERYFYIAEVLSIVYAVYFPRYFYIPALIQIPVLLSYLFYLVGSKPIPDQYPPFFLMAAIGLVAFDFVKQVRISRQRTNIPRRSIEEPASTSSQIAPTDVTEPTFTI